MSHDDALATYRREKLGGRAMPPDLRTLLILQWERGTAHDAEGADPLATMWVQLFDAKQSSDLLDHSYLNDEDRANPDIMANVAAMTSGPGTERYPRRYGRTTRPAKRRA